MTSNQPRSVHTRIRDHLKCSQCRHDNKKCQPRDRNWNGGQQKCDRCERLSHTCGPSTKLARRSPAATRRGGTRDQRPILSQGTLDTAVEPSTTAYPTVAQSGLLEARRTDEVAQMLTKLACLIVTHELHLLILFSYEERSRDPMGNQSKANSFQEELHCAVEWARASFSTFSHSIQCRLSQMEKSSEHELFSLKLRLFRQRHGNLLGVKSLLEARTRVSAEDHRALNDKLMDYREGTMFLCTARIFHHSPNLPVAWSVPPQLVESDYRDLEQRIETLAADLHEAGISAMHPPPLPEPNGSARLALKMKFTASHIAYWNWDPDIAMRLWRQSLTSQPGTDIMGRSFLHVVAACSDQETIWQILDHPASEVALGRRDKLGLFPLDLLKGPGTELIRTHMISRGARSASPTLGSYVTPSRHDLARLAGVPGSINFVSSILNHQHTVFSPGDVVQDLQHINFFQPIPVVQNYNPYIVYSSVDSEEHPITDQNTSFGLHPHPVQPYSPQIQQYAYQAIPSSSLPSQNYYHFADIDAAFTVLGDDDGNMSYNPGPNG